MMMMILWTYHMGLSWRVNEGLMAQQHNEDNNNIITVPVKILAIAELNYMNYEVMPC